MNGVQLNLCVNMRSLIPTEHLRVSVLSLFLAKEKNFVAMVFKVLNKLCGRHGKIVFSMIIMSMGAMVLKSALS